MSSKRDKEYARRRYGKRMERAARAERLRRERRIVASVSVAVLVITGGLIFFLNRDSGTAGNDETPTATSAAPTSTVEPLPTTQPQTWDAPPPAADSLNTTWTVTLVTNRGDIELSLDGAAAPQAVANMVFLSSEGFYDGTACHRLLPDSLLQCGDPSATGSGGPGYSFGPIENAPADDVYPAGTVAMARRGNDAESQGSQFFLVFADVPLPSDAAGGYTVLGTVTGGLDILEQIGAAGTIDGSTDGRPAEDVIIERVEVQ